MIPDHRKACALRLIDNETGERAKFDLIVYGHTAEELMTIPNDVISALANRYPGYTGSLFGMTTIRSIPKPLVAKPLATRPRRR